MRSNYFFTLLALLVALPWKGTSAMSFYKGIKPTNQMDNEISTGEKREPARATHRSSSSDEANKQTLLERPFSSPDNEVASRMTSRMLRSFSRKKKKRTNLDESLERPVSQNLPKAYPKSLVKENTKKGQNNFDNSDDGNYLENGSIEFSEVFITNLSKRFTNNDEFFHHRKVREVSNPVSKHNMCQAKNLRTCSSTIFGQMTPESQTDFHARCKIRKMFLDCMVQQREQACYISPQELYQQQDTDAIRSKIRKLLWSGGGCLIRYDS